MSLKSTRIMGRGYVDGVVKGEIGGWVYNADRKADQPEEVLVSTDLGRWTKFAAHRYREDVVASVGHVGKNGFVIPVDLLPPFRRRVYFYDSRGYPLPKGELELEPQAVADLSRRRVLFVHIPKTAGTSLRTFLGTRIKRSEFCEVYHGEENEIWPSEFQQIPVAQRAHFKLVMGHFSSGFSEWIPGEHRLVTFIRRPLERLKSQVLFHLRLLGRMFQTDSGNIPLEVAVNENRAEFCDNFQVRLIGNFFAPHVAHIESYHAQRAINLIMEKYDFVGRVENMATDFAEFTQYLGLPAAPLTTENARPEKLDAEAAAVVNAIDWAKVEERHAPELTLYNWVEKNSNWLNRRYLQTVIAETHAAE